MRLAPIADRVAASIAGAMQRGADTPSWDAMRDACDLATCADLPPSVLDRLTDMVARRVRLAAKVSKLTMETLRR